MSAYVTHTFPAPLWEKGLCDDIHLFGRVFPFRRRGEILGGGLNELSNRGEHQKEWNRQDPWKKCIKTEISKQENRGDYPFRKVVV